MNDLLSGWQFSCVEGLSEKCLAGVYTVNDDVPDANTFLQAPLTLLLLHLLSYIHLTTISSRLHHSIIISVSRLRDTSFLSMTIVC